MEENKDNNSVNQLASNINTDASVIQPEQPKQSNFLIILLTMLLFISVSIAGFFAYQTQRLVAELRIKNEELIIRTPTPTASSDPTADWKTYTDEKNRFLFKYPNDVEIKKESGRLSMNIPGLDYPLSIIPDGPHNWGEGMTMDQIDKIYIKQFQYPNDPDRKMFPDTDVQFVIEFQTLSDKNSAEVFLDKIDQILSTFKFTD